MNKFLNLYGERIYMFLILTATRMLSPGYIYKGEYNWEQYLQVDIVLVMLRLNAEQQDLEK